MNARQRASSLKKLGEHLSDVELSEILARRGGLGAEKYLDVLGLDIEAAIQKLESRASKYHKDKEEKLTAYIADLLERQTHTAEIEADTNGHVDLKVSKQSIGVLFLAEAKVHTSYPKNIKGMRQLLYRYSSGKEPRGGFLLYITKPGAARIMEKWRSEVPGKGLRCSKATTMLRRGVFDSHHKHKNDDPLIVRHYGVYLHYKPQDAPGKAKKKPKKKRKTK